MMLSKGDLNALTYVPESQNSTRKADDVPKEIVLQFGELYRSGLGYKACSKKLDLPHEVGYALIQKYRMSRGKRRNPERDAEVLRRVKAGQENLTIAKEMGLTRSQVGHIRKALRADGRLELAYKRHKLFDANPE